MCVNSFLVLFFNSKKQWEAEAAAATAETPVGMELRLNQTCDVMIPCSFWACIFRVRGLLQQLLFCETCWPEGWNLRCRDELQDTNTHKLLQDPRNQIPMTPLTRSTTLTESNQHHFQSSSPTCFHRLETTYLLNQIPQLFMSETSESDSQKLNQKQLSHRRAFVRSLFSRESSPNNATHLKDAGFRFCGKRFQSQIPHRQMQLSCHWKWLEN